MTHATQPHPLRADLGLPADALLIAPIDHPPHAADAWTLTLAVEFVTLLRPDLPVQLLVHPDQHRLGAAIDHLARRRSPRLLVQTHHVNDPPTLWPACDALLSLHAARQPYADRHAPNTPVVLAPDRPAHSPGALDLPRRLAAELLLALRPAIERTAAAR